MNCNKCGNPLEPFQTTCSFCGQPVGQNSAAPGEVAKPENVMGGVIGAVIGAVLGGASIILFAQMNMVAAISGLILAFCTLKGYELLGGQLSTKGIVISIVLMLVIPFIANHLCWAIAIMKEFGDLGITFGDALAAVPAFLEESSIMEGYIKDLLMVYGFTALGAFGTVKAVLKKR